MGSLSFMAAFAMVQGPQAWAKSVCAKDRIPFTAAYWGSIVGTLYACLELHSYVAIVFFAGVQLVALAHYAGSYLPGGRYGVRMIGAVVK